MTCRTKGEEEEGIKLYIFTRNKLKGNGRGEGVREIRMYPIV